MKHKNHENGKMLKVFTLVVILFLPFFMWVKGTLLQSLIHNEQS